MKPERMLTLASLLAILLATIHLADDVVRGYEPTGLANMRGVVLFAIWLGAALLLPEKRLRYVLLMLGSMLAIVMPVAHMLGKGLARASVSSGGLFFIWVLIALGVTGIFALMLSVDGLWKLRRARPPA